jgi:hypothetical protein
MLSQQEPPRDLSLDGLRQPSIDPRLPSIRRPGEGRGPCVRPAWARSCGCKSRRELTTASEAKHNCGRATDRGEEVWSETVSR